MSTTLDKPLTAAEFRALSPIAKVTWEVTYNERMAHYARKTTHSHSVHDDMATRDADRAVRAASLTALRDIEDTEPTTDRCPLHGSTCPVWANLGAAS